MVLQQRERRLGVRLQKTTLQPRHELKSEKCAPREDLGTTTPKRFVSQSRKPKQNISKCSAAVMPPLLFNHFLCIFCLSLSFKRHRGQGLPCFRRAVSHRPSQLTGLRSGLAWVASCSHPWTVRSGVSLRATPTSRRSNGPSPQLGWI